MNDRSAQTYASGIYARVVVLSRAFVGPLAKMIQEATRNFTNKIHVTSGDFVVRSLVC